MQKFISIIFFSLFLVLSGCTTAQIYNAEHIPISPRSSATEEEISEAIWLAGRREGWRIDKTQPGEMRGTKEIRSHFMTVKILYDRSNFSIYYVSSANLKEKEGEIHKNYNVWIKRLENKIQNEISFRLPNSTTIR